MSKSRKAGTTHTSLRLHPEVAANIDTAAKLSGWSVARIVGHMVRIGFAASSGKPAAVDELRAAYHGAIRLHAVEVDNARRLAAARKEILPGPRRPHPTRDAKSVASVAGRAGARQAKRQPAGKLPPVPEAGSVKSA